MSSNGKLTSSEATLNSTLSNGYSIEQPTGFRYTYKNTEIANALTILHEGIHAYINSQMANGKITVPRTDDQQHNYLADHFRKDIVAGLTEYNETQKLGLKAEEIETISWVGLESTDAFKKTFKTDEDQEKWRTAADKILKTKPEISKIDTPKPDSTKKDTPNQTQTDNQ